MVFTQHIINFAGYIMKYFDVLNEDELSDFFSIYDVPELKEYYSCIVKFPQLSAYRITKYLKTKICLKYP